MTTAYAKNSETSRESARILDESGAADSQAAEIAGYLERLGLRGGTADELTVWMQGNGFPHIHNGTVAGRLVHLEKAGRIIKTAVTRKTRSNRQANVYMLACHSDKVEIAVRISTPDMKKLLKRMCDVLDGGQVVRLEPNGEAHKIISDYLE